MRRFFAFGLVLAVIALAGVTSLQSGRSQETASPTAGALEGTQEGDLAGFTGERLGGFKSRQAPGLNQILQRHIYQPGGYISPHIRPGETIYYLDYGTLQFTLLEGEARVEHIAIGGTPAAGTPTAIETITPGTEVTLNAGDALYFDETALQTIRNDSDDIAVVYVSNLRPNGVPARLFPEQMATPAATPSA